jgi:hydroxylamine dehydrogenase
MAGQGRASGSPRSEEKQRNRKASAAARLLCGLLPLACALLALALPQRGWTQIEAEKEFQDCLRCHSRREPKLVQDWQQSKHSAHHVGCTSCHGTSHELMVETGGRVSAARCSTCHGKQRSTFLRSRHSVAWARMEQDAAYQRLPEGMRLATCQSCHSVSRKCDSCHTRHRFDPAEARRPSACATCHSGPHAPQSEAYESSRHGTLYRSEKGIGRAPACVTCHMTQGDHDVSRGLAHGPVGHDSLYIGLDNKIITEQMVINRREDMVRVCSQCHSRIFVTMHLEAADELHRATEGVLQEARALLEPIRKAGLVPASATVPLSGSRAGEEPVPPLEARVVGSSRVEEIYRRMVHETGPAAWKGAYHMSPTFTQTHGWDRLQRDLAALKQETRQPHENAQSQGQRRPSGIKGMP